MEVVVVVIVVVVAVVEVVEVVDPWFGNRLLEVDDILMLIYVVVLAGW